MVRLQTNFTNRLLMNKKAVVKTLLLLCSIALLGNIIFVTVSNPERSLSVYFDDGNCEWEPPDYDIPEGVNFSKTIIVEFPGSDNSQTVMQMEALTGLAAKTDWDFNYLGVSNHPFIQSHYPHNEGIWGWGDSGDHVVLVVHNIRDAMLDYHNLVWNGGALLENSDKWFHTLFGSHRKISLNDILAWRDQQVLYEIHRYGWFIDYWMESGLLRDIYTHKLTSLAHWSMLIEPAKHNKTEQDTVFNGLLQNDNTIEESHDPRCANKVSGGCQPIQIISSDLLIDDETGPAENRKIALALSTHNRMSGMSEFVIEEDAWDCIWDHTIHRKENLGETDSQEQVVHFSQEILEEMLHELDRLIEKYGSAKWNSEMIAEDLVYEDLVSILSAHRASIQEELDTTASSSQLLNTDFLGPKEREKRRPRPVAGIKVGRVIAPDARNHIQHLNEEQRDWNSEYLGELHTRLMEKRISSHQDDTVYNNLRRMRKRRARRNKGRE
uniref:Uncharacterized protein n=2 Tax=Chaetoceros debilis TaxID=122233 RepID=A0A7S3V5F0_9STRA|mmetsp:Transcript_5397/g.8017  ORF Transcript_5397/g.8017 Transcript_5397/m.8017 type:complete len:495 (+) Transcript_5397:71-1555(+)